MCGYSDVQHPLIGELGQGARLHKTIMSQSSRALEQMQVVEDRVHRTVEDILRACQLILSESPTGAEALNMLRTLTRW